MGDFNNVSDIILMPSSCIRPRFGSILMYPTLFQLHFSLSGNFFTRFLWKCAPRCSRKHNSEYRHEAFLMKILPSSTSKRPKLSLCWSCFSALSLCRSLFSPFIRSMPHKLHLKKPRKYVYYCYRWLPWPTLMMHPTLFSWHLDASAPTFVIFWCIWHDLGNIFHFSVTCFHDFYENVLPAHAASTILKVGTKHL